MRLCCGSCWFRSFRWSLSNSEKKKKKKKYYFFICFFFFFHPLIYCINYKFGGTKFIIFFLFYSTKNRGKIPYNRNKIEKYIYSFTKLNAPLFTCMRCVWRHNAKKQKKKMKKKKEERIRNPIYFIIYYNFFDSRWRMKSLSKEEKKQKKRSKKHRVSPTFLDTLNEMTRWGTHTPQFTVDLHKILYNNKFKILK